MDESHEHLLLGSGPLEPRLRALDQVLQGPDAGARLEAALPDLLREGEEGLLLRAAEGLAQHVGRDGAARRVLEVLARRSGGTRAAALRALRGPGGRPGAAQPG